MPLLPSVTEAWLIHEGATRRMYEFLTGHHRKYARLDATDEGWTIAISDYRGPFVGDTHVFPSAREALAAHGLYAREAA